MEIFPQDRDPPEEFGRLEPEEEAGYAGQVELPAGQRDVGGGEDGPRVDTGENNRICTSLLSCDNKLYTQLEPVLSTCTVHYNAHHLT